MKIIFSLLLLFSMQAWSQQKMVYVVSGHVTDEQGLPVKGASVVPRQNPLSGTTTDRSGFFILELNYPSANQLSITHNNYQRAEVDTKGSTLVNITLRRNYITDGYVYGVFPDRVKAPVTARTIVPPVKEMPDKIFAKVEMASQFKGSFSSYLGKFIDSNSAFFVHKGMIVIDFLVNEKGNIETAELRQGLGTLADSMLLNRLLASSGKWSPAIQNGVPGKSWRRLQVEFKDGATPGMQTAEWAEKTGPEQVKPIPRKNIYTDTLALPPDELTANIYQLMEQIDIGKEITDILLQSILGKQDERLADKMKHRFKANTPAYLYLRNFTAHELRKNYNAAQIKQLMDFYKTPLGKESGILTGVMLKAFLINADTILGNGDK